jgi:hypothetical protein
MIPTMQNTAIKKQLRIVLERAFPVPSASASYSASDDPKAIAKSKQWKAETGAVEIIMMESA